MNALPAFNMADLDLLPRDPALTVKAYSMLQGTDTLLILAEARHTEAQIIADAGDAVMAGHDADTVAVANAAAVVTQDTLLFDHIHYTDTLNASIIHGSQVDYATTNTGYVSDLATKTARTRSTYSSATNPSAPTGPGGAGGGVTGPPHRTVYR